MERKRRIERAIRGLIRFLFYLIFVINVSMFIGALLFKGYESAFIYSIFVFFQSIIILYSWNYENKLQKLRDSAP